MNNKRSVKLLFLFAFIASSVQASIVSFGLISYSPNSGSVFSLPAVQTPAPPPPVQNTFTAVGDPVYPLVGNTTVYKAPTTVSSITPDPYAITLDTQAAVLNRQLVTNYNTPIVATNVGFAPVPIPSYNYGFSYTTPYSSGYSYAGYGSLIASSQFTGYYNPPTPPLVVTGAQNTLWTSVVSATTFSSGGGIVTSFDTAPEPATLVLFGAGIGSLLIYRRKRIAAAQRQE
jgi:hypothetical protein